MKLHWRPTQRRSRIIALVVACIVGLGLTGSYLAYRFGLQPVSSDTTTVSFTISAGQNAPAIATALKSAGLIRDRNAFVSYVNFHGLRAKLKTGVYELSPSMSANAIADRIAGGRTLTRQLVVPEGYTLSQIETAAVAAGISKSDFQAALKANYNYAFLAGKPAGVPLEGYLFPDSYSLNAGTTAQQMVELMLTTFADRVGPEYIQAFTAQGLTLHQGLTLASIVEREVNIAADRPVVAQIFLKRFKSGQSLGSDVTTEYAAKLLGVPFNIDINSPYNTRRFAGLPPGPICSPGLSALDAVARPATTDYLYFLSGKDGKTYFAKTYSEHQGNIIKYLQ